MGDDGVDASALPLVEGGTTLGGLAELKYRPPPPPALENTEYARRAGGRRNCDRTDMSGQAQECLVLDRDGDDGAVEVAR